MNNQIPAFNQLKADPVTVLAVGC